MKPVRFYLILLFIAVFGVGLYLTFKQYNEDLDTNSALSGQDFRQAAAESDSAQVAAGATAKTTIDTDAEVKDIDTLLGAVPEDDFSDADLSDSALGL
ncbi:MAG TPA: hypothetical protein VLA04_00205 [Verrucomicrobiae bacterium]|nr:hypothetical protein [Verrucomicrobiae bacterium]